MNKKTDSIYIGKHKVEERKKIVTVPKKRYRIVIQERYSGTNEVEKSRSFMIYDFQGKTTVDSIKRRLLKFLK